MSDLDLNALDNILQNMNLGVYNDPGGDPDWIAALSAWTVDESEQYNRDDPATLAQKLSTIWEIGTLVEKELAGRFQIRATTRAQFPYTATDGELKAGVIDVYTLKILSEDPREIACAIAAEVVKAADPEQNVVMFRRLVQKIVRYSYPAKTEYRTSFGLARV